MQQFDVTLNLPTKYLVFEVLWALPKVNVISVLNRISAHCHIKQAKFGTVSTKLLKLLTT